MSAPVVPNKACYTQEQDNRIEIKNNNESIVSVGDTNANQIVTKVRTTEGEGRRCGLRGETGSVHTDGSEKLTQLDAEQNKLLVFKESQICDINIQEHRQPSAVSKKLDKDCKMDEAKVTSRHLCISRGQSLSNLKSSANDSNTEVLSKGDAEFTQHLSKGKMVKAVEVEGIKRLSLGRPSKFSAKTETFAKECTGRVSHKRLLSASLDSIDTSHHLIGNTEKSQKTSADHFLGMVFHPLDNTSEENIVFYSKPSTSENKKLNKPEIQMDADNIPNVNSENTLQAFDAALNVTVKPCEISSKPEAQLSWGDKSRKLEFKTAPSLQSKNICQQKIERIMLVEFLGCQKKESTLMQEKKGLGDEVSKMQASQFQDICREAEDPHLNPVIAYSNDRLLTDHITCRHLRGGMTANDSRATNQVTEEYITNKEVETFSLPDDSKPSGKVMSAKNKSIHEADTSCIGTVGEHVSFIQNINLPDSKTLKINENKLMLVKGNIDNTRLSASDLTDQHRVLSTERVSNEHPNNQDSDLETVSFSIQNKKTIIAKKHLSDEAPESYKISAKADAFLCVPAPLRPVATVHINNQPTISNGNLKDLYALHVDKLSPSSVLPPIDDSQLLNISPKVPIKTACNSGIPKPILVHSKGSFTDKNDIESDCIEKPEENIEITPAIPKPKHVRPKIITYIRRNPQSIEGSIDPSFAPTTLSYGSPACGVPMPKEQKTSTGGDIKPPNILYDKFKPDLQKPRNFGSGLVVSGIRPPGHHFGPMSEKFLQEVGERPVKEEFCSPPYAHYEVPPSFYRSAMILKPQLGLGAVSRLPSTKSRILIASQRSSGSCLHQPGEITNAPSLYHPDTSVDLKKGPCPNAAKSNLPKPCQSGLRPPGYSRMPAAKLAAFGFVRSSSVSSVSSNQSNDSVQSDQGRTTNRSSFGNEEQATPKAAAPSKDIPKGTSRATLQGLSSTATPRRSLLPAPKTATAPAAGLKKEVQKDQDANRSTVSSPKRLAASATKLHSPGHPKQRPTTPKNGISSKPDPQTREAERQFVQQLKEKCDEQSKQLSCIHEELKRASRGFDIFAITTQYFFRKNESALVKEKELSIELANIRDEVALNTARCEKLQKEKEELEKRFEDEVRKLHWQQQEELQALEDRLQLQYSTELERLQEENKLQLMRIKCQHQEQVEDITATHEASVLEVENSHTIAIAVLQDEHDSKVQELMSAHELEKKELEENFEKLRLSLQDQVDTLTFQNQSLRDKAKRFEEALKKNTEEQLEVALAPYQHLEEDMNSLKQVLEMKNQLIHQQEKRIMELERLAEINLILEEKIQVLQQQNEDFRVRIDQNTVVTRQLSEENANLQEHVEKETEEKKRLSRTNEELLWKLQAGDAMSPVKLSPTSPTPIYRCSSGPPTPAKVSTVPR